MVNAWERLVPVVQEPFVEAVSYQLSAISHNRTTILPPPTQTSQQRATLNEIERRYFKLTADS